MAQEPIFLTREQIEEIHRLQVADFGGIHGLRNSAGLESALAEPINVYYYSNGDLFEIAATYAYHIAESQAYLDGNKRTECKRRWCSSKSTESIRTSYPSSQLLKR